MGFRQRLIDRPSHMCCLHCSGLHVEGNACKLDALAFVVPFDIIARSGPGAKPKVDSSAIGAIECVLFSFFIALQNPILIDVTLCLLMLACYCNVFDSLSAPRPDCELAGMI